MARDKYAACYDQYFVLPITNCKECIADFYNKLYCTVVLISGIKIIFEGHGCVHVLYHYYYYLTINLCGVPVHSQSQISCE